jgi:hypothetical protein
MLQLNAKQLVTALHTSFKLDEPLFIWSGPGIGKSDVSTQVTHDVGGQLVDVRLSMWDSVDVRGIPIVQEGVTTWNPPAVLPFVGNPRFNKDKPIILFLDELMQAMPAVQAVAFQLVLERAVGEHKLMDNVRVIAASNRQSDRAGANRMATPLANRFMHVEMIPHLDSWCEWAWSKDLNPLPVAFLRMRPDLLNTFDPSKGDVAFATPRSWAKVCSIVSAKVPLDVRYPLIAGTIGEGPAAELEAFMRTWESMPNIDALLLNPSEATVPDDPATLFAVTAALAQRAEKGNFDSICTYAQRLPQEYAMRLVSDSVKRKPEVQITKAFNKFAVANAGMWED